MILNYKAFGCLATISVVSVLGCVTCVAAQGKTKPFESNVATPVKPWTHLNFFNDPADFKFAIMSDRAGGVRPGVFEDAARKINLIMPEFVMSVGDFIPGNSADREELLKEWADFDAELRPLKVPFFFVPGNHDINNDVMRDVWKERSGVPFYSFVYKNVLFLALDSTGEKGDIVPEYQVEYVREALNKYPDARWTFVFLHHPLWLYENAGGFRDIENLLSGRKYTVIAGHTHRYLHQERNNTNYYVLSTTGGGSKLRGNRYGEFDHITLVTVTDEGPIIANLRLDGILPHDVTTKEDYKLTEALVHCTELPYTLLTDREDAVTAGTLALTFRNLSEKELQVKADFMHAHEIHLEPQNIAMTLAAKSEKTVEVAIRTTEPVPTDKPALLQLRWTMGFDLAGNDDLFLSGTRDIVLQPSKFDLISTVSPEFVDSLSIAAAPLEGGFTLHYTLDGSAPTMSSPSYEGPLTIHDATTLKVRKFNDAGHGSATSTQSYKPVPAGTGLRYRLYKGTWTKLPDFSKLTPAFESVASDLNVEKRQQWPDNWGMVLEGDFNIDQAGEYTFFLKSDDGSKLYIDDQLVVDNDGDHSVLELKGAKELTAGRHKLRIDFFEAASEAILELQIQGPGMERQPFPVEKISH